MKLNLSNRYKIFYDFKQNGGASISTDITDYFIPSDIFYNTKFVIKSNKFIFNDILNKFFADYNIPVLDLNFLVFAQDNFIFYIRKENPEYNYLKIVVNTQYELATAFNLDDKDRLEIVKSIEEKIENLHVSRFSMTSQITTYDKGGNFLGIPLSHAYISLNPKELMMCKMMPEKCFLLKPYSNIEGHIDEILCFMPYGPDEYKVWCYEPFNTEKLPIQIKELIETNFAYNKEKLETKFGKEKIIYFPLEFNENGFILNPPLFNRLCIKKENDYLFLFPDQTHEIKELIDIQIRIMETNFTINVNYIDTITSHMMTGTGNSIGGNLHCIVKQVL